MKLLIILAILALTSPVLTAQKFSVKIDSLTRITMKKLPPDQKRQFETIIKNRASVAFLQRIDTTKSDYIFIEEQYNISYKSINVSERYFFNSSAGLLRYSADGTPLNGTIPRYLFINAVKQPVEPYYYSDVVAGIIYSNVYEFYYTLDSLVALSSTLKPFQELTFDPTPVVSLTTDSIVNQRPELEKAVVERLKTTWQVLTFVDKVNKKVIVSFQRPARDPKVHIEFVKFNYWSW